MPKRLLAFVDTEFSVNSKYPSFAKSKVFGLTNMAGYWLGSPDELPFPLPALRWSHPSSVFSTTEPSPFTVASSCSQASPTPSSRISLAMASILCSAPGASAANAAAGTADDAARLNTSMQLNSFITLRLFITSNLLFLLESPRNFFRGILHYHWCAL